MSQLSTTPRVVHVLGARPNFPKSAPVIAALQHYDLVQRIVHTGQHYDPTLSEIFFDELGIPEPDVHLKVGSSTHAQQTAAVMTGLEQLFLKDRPDLVIVYGDVNSTVGAGLVAAKLGIDLAHVEAGLRSFDRAMPEEINRIVVDRLAQLLFATSTDAIAHLGGEGVDPASIHFVGNPMIDTLLRFRDSLSAESVEMPGAIPERFAVATIHRPSNVDDPAQIRIVIEALHRVADLVDLVIPLHPRGERALREAGLCDHERIHVLSPLGYLEFLGMVNSSVAVITDSGGVQEETTVLGVPCLTLRDNTERPVTITHGTNQLVTPEALPSAMGAVLDAGRPTTWPVPPLWDGHAGARIAEVIARHLEAVRA